MKLGCSIPLTAMAEPSAVRDFAQTLDGAGFDYTTVGGHLLSAPPGRFEGRPEMTYIGPFYDPFVLFSHLAGVTSRLHFFTSVVTIPLMPTALVAKQAAELAFFSGGRFTLGCGIGWSEPEYQALGQDVHTRGRRLEEQVRLLRRFWTEPFVQFKSRRHTIDGVGLNRLPASPIQIWLGCSPEDALLRRVARLADGWLPLAGDLAEPATRLKGFLAEEGRDPSKFGLMGRLIAGPDGPDSWIAAAEALDALGVTHASIGAPPGTDTAGILETARKARQVLADAGLAGS